MCSLTANSRASSPKRASKSSGRQVSPCFWTKERMSSCRESAPAMLPGNGVQARVWVLVVVVVGFAETSDGERSSSNPQLFLSVHQRCSCLMLGQQQPVVCTAAELGNPKKCETAHIAPQKIGDACMQTTPPPPPAAPWGFELAAYCWTRMPFILGVGRGAGCTTRPISRLPLLDTVSISSPFGEERVTHSAEISSAEKRHG